VTVLNTITPLTNEVKNELFMMAEWLARSLAQEAVLLRLGDEALFVRPTLAQGMYPNFYISSS
jgi:hypothetical protein